jgi:hypothetical protein
MTNFDKNIRTLIVCFVIAIVWLVPLRFAEVANQQSIDNQPKVLGVETINSETPVKEVDLSKRCLSESDVSILIDKIEKDLNRQDLDQAKIDEVTSQIEEIKNSQCAF